MLVGDCNTITTMRCEEIQNLLPELLRGELSPAIDGYVQAHLTDCRSCGAVQVREQHLQSSLRALPLPVMAEDFPARALRCARTAHQATRQQSRLRRAGRASALAASVLMVCGLAFVLGRGTAETVAGQQVAVSVPLGSAQMVALKIDAPHAFERVEFEVRLPDNVALEDQPNLREFAWSGTLQAGVNVLSLPLVGIKEAGGQLVARVKYGATEKSLHVPVTVSVKS